MKKAIRNKAVLTLTALMSIYLIAGCNSNSPNPSSNETSPSEPVKVKFWMPLQAAQAAVVKNMSEVSMIQEWQRKENIVFDWIHPAGASTNDILQQYGVMISSNDLPDTMFWGWKPVPGGTAKMYKDGTIIKLNDLIDKHAPNLKKIMKDYPDVAKQMRADNGDIYTLPDLRVGEYGKYKTFSGLMIRQDWLDELGLTSPTTVDEWETVLTAFKDKKGVEAPFSISKDNPISTNDFAGAFGVGMDNGFYVDKGKVKFGPLEPAYKQYLTTMQNWYKKGLIDVDFATNDSKTLNAKITSGKTGAFYGFIGGTMGTLLPAMQGSNPKASITATQYPVLNKGDEPKFIKTNWEFSGAGAVITTANKHPEATVKAFDYLYSQEGAMLRNFGIEGQTYNIVNSQPVYTDLILKNPDKLPVSQAMAKYFYATGNFVGTSDDRYNDQLFQLQQQKDAVQTYSKYANNAYEVLMPMVSLTTDEAKEYAKIINDVNTYLSEIITKTIMGANSLNSYDGAIDQLKKMNIDRAIQIQQAAVDRFKKRE